MSLSPTSGRPPMCCVHKPQFVMKPVVGFEGKYAVTSDGRVYSYKAERFMRSSLSADGHLVVNLWERGTKTKKVHLLVLEAFRGVCPSNFVAIFGDGDRLNNNIANLKWGLRSANV